MSATSPPHRAYQNEAFRVEVRYTDPDTEEPWELEDGRMRAVMPLTAGVFDPDGTETELFDVVPTQDVEGWVTGYVPASTMADLPTGAALFDMALKFADEDEVRAAGGTLQILRGISEW